MNQPILMLLSKPHNHRNKNGREAHPTLQIKDTEITTITVVDLGQEVVVDRAALHSVVQTAVAWVVD